MVLNDRVRIFNLVNPMPYGTGFFTLYNSIKLEALTTKSSTLFLLYR